MYRLTSGPLTEDNSLIESPETWEQWLQSWESEPVG